MSKKFRIAVIGCGAICSNHISAILRTGHTVCALCDIRPERAQKMIDKFALNTVSVYTDYVEMLDTEQPDAVHICTPHHLHVQMSVEALNRNIHVLCEKPICIDLQQLELLHDAVQKSRAQFGACLQNRYEPNMQRLHEIAQTYGVIGAFGSVVWNRDAAYYASEDWRGTRDKEGGGVMINQALHTLDILQWICGMPIYVTAHISNDHLGGVIEVEDTASARFETANGTVFHIFATTAAGADMPVEIQLRLSNGRTVVAQNKHMIIDHESLPQQKSETNIGKAVWGNGHAWLIADFYNCLSLQKSFPIGIGEAEKTIRLIQTIYHSGGKRIAIE